VDSLALENFGNVLGGREFVPRRIRRIDADQALEPADGVALEFGDLHGLCGRGLRWRRSEGRP